MRLKTNAKRLFAGFLAAVITVIAVPCGVTAAKTAGNFLYTVKNGCVTITGYDEYTESVVIPAEIDGMPVTKIGVNAFRYQPSLKSATIPDSVTEIGDGAFYSCALLEKADIPANVRYIGENAFYYCQSLDKVTIPDSVTYVGDYAFFGCDWLYTINIADSVTGIGAHVFEGTAFYEDDYNWVNGALYIGNHLIATNYNIGENFIIREGTRSLAGDSVKGYNDRLKSVTIPDSVVYIGDYAFYMNVKISEICIPENVTTIGKNAFSYCHDLEEVTLCEGLISIGDYAFTGCSDLGSITIPQSVTHIGNSAFSGCHLLKTVKLPEGLTELSSNLFYSCYNLESITLPDGITKIGEGAFYGCDKLREINLPKGIAGVGANAFAECIKLTTVYLPSSLEVIGNYAFANCTALADIIIPNGIESLSEGTFSGCEKLLDITIPADVTVIGDKCFELCYKIDNIYYGGSEADWKSIDIGADNEGILYAAKIYDACTHANEELVGAIDAGCLEYGYTGDTHCKDCKILLAIGKSIPARGHFGGISHCYSGAICEGCGTEYTASAIANHLETVVIGAVEATETAEGFTGDVYCKYCDLLLEYGTVIPRLPLPGDVNDDGAVNLSDVSLLLKHVANWDVALDTSVADVTSDGYVNLADASLILKYVANWDVILG